MIHVRVIKQGGYATPLLRHTVAKPARASIDFLPLFYGVGLTSLLFTRNSQRSGDLVAGTLVVYQDPVETQALCPTFPEPPRRNSFGRRRSLCRFLEI